MASYYPAIVETNATFPPIKDGQPVTGAIGERLRESILAIEAELGTKPSGPYSTVRARLDTLEGIVGNLHVIELQKDLGGTLEDPLVIGIQGRPVSTTPPQPGEVLVWDGIAWSPATGPSAAITFGGDLAGSPLIQTVVGLQNRPLLTTAPTTGQAVVWNGTAWAPGNVASGVSGPAGGDLTGTYPNPQVKQSTTSAFTIFGTEFAFTGGTAPGGLDLPATDAVRVGLTTTDATPNQVINSVTPQNHQMIRVMSEIGATRTDIPGDAAWFLLRGVWVREDNALITVKPSTIVDSAATPNATSWKANLADVGTQVQTQVTGEKGKTIQWSIIREWMESTGGDNISCQLPPYTEPNGMAFDGTFLWVGDKNSAIITKVDPFTEAPTVVSTLDLSRFGTTSFSISGASNASPIQISTFANNNLTTGQTVTITGVTGNTAANGTWTITSLNAHEFTLDGSVGNGAYTGGGTVIVNGITNTRHVKYDSNRIYVSCMDSGLLVIINVLTESVIGVASINQPGETSKIIWSQVDASGNVWAIKNGDPTNGSFAGSVCKMPIASILSAFPATFTVAPANVFPAPAHPPGNAQCHLETLTFGAGFLWASGGALNGNPNSPIFRIDPATGTFVSHTFIGNFSNIWGVHFAFGSVWASGYGRYIMRFNPATFPSEPDAIIDTFPNTANGTSEMTDDGTTLWVTNIAFSGQSYIYRVDPNTNTVLTRVFTTLNGGTGAPTFDGINMWMCSRNSNHPSIVKIKGTLSSEAVLTYLPPPFDTPHTLTFDNTHLWVGDTQSSLLFKITTNPNTQPCPGCYKVVDLSSFGVNGVREVRYNDGIVYACCFNDNKVILIDVATDTVVGVCNVDNRSRSITFDGAGNFWTSTINSSFLFFTTIYKFSIADTLAAFPSSPTPLFQHQLSHHVETLAFANGFLWLSSGGFQNFGATDYFSGGSAASLNGSTLSGLTGMTAEMVGYYLILNNCSVSTNNAMFQIASFIDSTSVTLSAFAVGPSTDGNNGAIVWNLIRAQAEPLMRIDPSDLRTGTAASITTSGPFNRTVTVSGLTGMSSADIGKSISFNGAAGTCFQGTNNNNVLQILTVVNPTTVTVDLGYIGNQGPPGYNSGCAQPVTDANNGAISWMLLVSHNAWDYQENAYVWGIFPAYGSIWAGDGFHGVQRWDISNYHPLPSMFPLATANPKSIISPTSQKFFQGEWTDDGQTVWTTAGYGSGGSHAAVRIDPVTNAIIAEIPSDDGASGAAWADGCAYDGHNVWITVRNNARPGIVRFSTALGNEIQNGRVSIA